MSGDAAALKYKNNLKQAIKQRGYTLQDVAEGTKIPYRSLYDYCAGRTSIPRQRLEGIANFIGCSVSLIEGGNNALDAQSALDLENDEMNRKRRNLLETLCIAGSALLLDPNIDWDHISKGVEKPSYVDDELLQELEAINHHYWRMFLVAPSKAIILDAAFGQFKLLTQLLQETRSAPIHKKICTLTSNLGQLVGEIFFDLRDYNTAQACYAFAASSAKEANHYDLWACSLIRHAFLPLYSGRYGDAITLLQESLKLSSRGDSKLVMRFWIAAVEAEAQAGSRHLYACQSALDIACEVRSTQSSANDTWLRFNDSRLSELQGACFVRLQQPQLAFPALKIALQQHMTPTRRRGMVLNDLAIASLQSGDAEQACVYANESVTIALQGSSGVVKNGLLSLRNQLKPFADVDAVKALNQRIKNACIELD